MAKSKQKLLSLRWPLGGLDKRTGYQDQRPYTTPDCLNVWPTSQEDGRERGGSRPGLCRAITGGGSSKSNMLGTVRYNDSGTMRDVAVMASNGTLYKCEDDETSWTALTGTIDTGRLVHCTEYLGALYIASDTTNSYLKYTPPTTVATWTADTGTLPELCQLICTWNDRIVLAGNPADAHNWHMSRLGDVQDWTTSALDVASPVSGNNADAGYLGEAITALIPHGNDCLIFGCENSLWAMRGDPAAGGRIMNLSRTIGILPGKAYAITAEGVVYFLSNDGLYRMENPCGSVPVSVSRERIPEELLYIDTSAYTVLMEYDKRFRGIHIYCSNTSSATAGTHFWFSLQHESFWPITFGTTNQEPFSICRFPSVGSSAKSDVLLGSRLGKSLQYDTSEFDDDSNEFESYLMFGPLALGRDNIHEGIVQSLSGVLTEESGMVDWAVYSGKTYEKAIDTDEEPKASGVWTISGLNFTSYPRVRGGAFGLKLSNDEDNDGWSCEEVNVVIRDGGKRRGP